MDLIAQLDTAHHCLLIGIGAAGAGTGFGGLIWWILGRSVKKAIAHPDDQEVHLKAGIVYVTMEDCTRMHERNEQLEQTRVNSIKGELAAHTLDAQNRNQAIQTALKEHTGSISKIHERIDEAIKQQNDDAKAILTAIGKIQTKP